MPVLLRATGAGSRQVPSSSLHRPPSLQSAQERAQHRRVSNLSGTPSVATGNTILQVPQPTPVRRTATSSTAQTGPKSFGDIFNVLYKRFQLKRLFPLVIIAFYMMFGAILFYLIESDGDNRKTEEAQENYDHAREMLWRRIDEIVWENRNMSTRSLSMRRSARKKLVDEAIEFFQNNIGYQTKTGYGWDFMSSMYFAGTLFTTIGYGDIACVTAVGRVATVIYSLLGIPLMLITLNELGKFMYSNITGCVRAIDGAYLGVLRICQKPVSADEVDMVERGERGEADASSLASQIGSQHDFDDFEDVEDPKARMSVKVAVGITFGWIFFCAALFRLWEDWTYGESIYFMYISLSTIGLGDISVNRRDMMVLCFVFVIVGLSLVSMCINVVQVALEDFYCALIMKLVLEYQQKLAEGGGELGASAGMLKLWGNNRAAKFLMPLLSKEKKREAMERVEVEAKKQGIEIPPILTDLDTKTGMPKLLQIVENKESDEPHPMLEEMVQKQIMLEEAAAIPMYIAHDEQIQTDAVICMNEGQQTEEKEIIDGSTQTEEESRDCADEGTQTQDTKSLSEIETQTARTETTDQETATSSVSTSESAGQTDVVDTQEEEVQTWVELNHAQVGTELETKNIRIQTPNPVIEQRTIQTENLELRKSPSKMSSAKKRLRRAFAKPMRSSSSGPSPAMSGWKEVDEEDEDQIPEEVDEQEEEGYEHEEGSPESLHWDPVDGMHAEKQLPVARLTQLFNKNSDELRRRTSDGSRRLSTSFNKKKPQRHRNSSE